MQDVIFKVKGCYAGIMVKTKYRIPKHLNSIVFIYYFGKLFGLLPIQYRPSRRRSRFYTDPGKFRGSKLGILLSFAQFMIESWTFYVVTKYLLESAMMRTEALCSQGNYCSAFGLLLSHTVIALLVILIVPLRYKSTIVCFNQANEILFNRRIKQNLSVTYYSLLPFTFSIIVKIIISNIGFYIKEPELYYPYNLAYFGPIIIINVVGVLCCICEQEYDEINQEIKQLCSKDVNKKYKTEKLKLLMDDHWFATNFLDNISKCFAVDLFLIMIDIYVQLVLFLYVTLWSMFAQKVFSGHIWPHAAGLLEVMIILVKLVYLCYRCDRAVAKGNFTLFHLRHLSTVTTYDFDIQPVVSIANQILIKIFTLKLNSRDIMITAYGFFTINLALLVRIIGAVLTYFLVLIQFQVDGETSMATTSPPTKNCPSWPCLKPSK